MDIYENQIIPQCEKIDSFERKRKKERGKV